jgi:hypothetical protein
MCLLSCSYFPVAAAAAAAASMTGSSSVDKNPQRRVNSCPTFSSALRFLAFEEQCK